MPMNTRVNVYQGPYTVNRSLTVREKLAATMRIWAPGLSAKLEQHRNEKVGETAAHLEQNRHHDPNRDLYLGGV